MLGASVLTWRATGHVAHMATVLSRRTSGAARRLAATTARSLRRLRGSIDAAPPPPTLPPLPPGDDGADLRRTASEPLGVAASAPAAAAAPAPPLLSTQASAPEHLELPGAAATAAAGSKAGAADRDEHAPLQPPRSAFAAAAVGKEEDKARGPAAAGGLPVLVPVWPLLVALASLAARGAAALRRHGARGCARLAWAGAAWAAAVHVPVVIMYMPVQT